MNNFKMIVKDDNTLIIEFDKTANLLDLFTVLRSFKESSNFIIIKVLLLKKIANMEKRNDITHYIKKNNFIELEMDIRRIINNSTKDSESTYIILQENNNDLFSIEITFYNKIEESNLISLKILKKEKVLFETYEIFKSKYIK